jgi:hypothetical protein
MHAERLSNRAQNLKINSFRRAAENQPETGALPIHVNFRAGLRELTRLLPHLRPWGSRLSRVVPRPIDSPATKLLNIRRRKFTAFLL